MVTYVNDLRLSELATGEGSGTWGTTTNANLELIGEALGYGTQNCFSSDANATTTVADGATDPARAMYFKVTSSATLSATRELTIAPNTLNRVMIIENATTGSQIITIKQGSGNTVNVANGSVKVLYLDGAGSGAAVQDGLVDLDLTGTTSAVNLDISGDIDIDGTTNLDVVDIDGAVNMASTLTSGTDVGINSEYAVLGDDTSSRQLKFTQYQTGGSYDNAGHKINASSGYGELALAVGGTNALTLNASQKATFAGEVAAASLSINGTTVSSTAAELNVLDPALKENNSIWIGSDPSGTTSTASNNVALGVNALAAITTSDDNTAVGHEAGNDLTSGHSSVFVGHNAGGKVTTSNYNVAIGVDSGGALNAATGQYNVSVGGVAGYKLTTGANNTLIGTLAGEEITEGLNNVAVGTYAGEEITTGSNNVAVGYRAGGGISAAALTGTHNISIGNDAGGRLTSGGDNIFMGYAAGTNHTTATKNIFIGIEAGEASTTSDSNIGIGYRTLEAVTTANLNTAVGTQALATNTVGDRNTAVGWQALFQVNQASNEDTANVAVGMHAGRGITTGTQNVAIGTYAMEDGNVVGDYNTAVGTYAAEKLISGTQNVMLGAFAGQEITTADANTAIGYNAGGGASAAASTGAGNTSLGHSALEAVTTGHSNVALGKNALIATNTGAANTAIGYQAMTANTTGIYNVAVGENALTANVDDHGSVAVGYRCLYSANYTTSATYVYNVALGYQAGYSVSTGTSNVIIGGNAGQDTVPLTTGDSNVIIGRSARTSGGDSNQQIVIGRDVTGNADDSFCFGNGTTDSAIAFGATTITQPSDVRYKENIEGQQAGLSFINDLRPVTFDWKKKKDLPKDHRAYEDSEKRAMNDKTNHGFIAQEVKAVIDAHPEIADGFDMWSEDEADGRQRVGSAALIPILVTAIQELSAELKEIKEKL